MLKLGKKAARPGAVKLQLKKYLNLSVVAEPTPEFGHELMVKPNPWRMLGNDSVGDCYWAGSAHETMLWNASGGRVIDFTDQGVIDDYSAATGYNRNDPNTDQGTDIQQGAAYRQKVGIIDANGVRHKIGAYLAITVGDIQEHCIAAWLFDAVGVGIEFPGSAMDQFNNKDIWDVVSGATIEGGHYVPFFARRTGNCSTPNFVLSTWGELQWATDNFFTTYNDESLAYISEERLRGTGLDIRGFDLDQLNADLAALQPTPSQTT